MIGLEKAKKVLEIMLQKAIPAIDGKRYGSSRSA